VTVYALLLFWQLGFCRADLPNQLLSVLIDATRHQIPHSLSIHLQGLLVSGSI
jgi:hypothetical protein